MKVKLKNNSLNAAQVLWEPTKDFQEATMKFPFRRFGDKEAGGFFTETPEGIMLEPHWGDWIIWNDVQAIAYFTDELFKQLFEVEE